MAGEGWAAGEEGGRYCPTDSKTPNYRTKNSLDGDLGETMMSKDGSLEGGDLLSLGHVLKNGHGGRFYGLYIYDL